MAYENSMIQIERSIKQEIGFDGEMMRKKGFGRCFMRKAKGQEVN